MWVKVGILIAFILMVIGCMLLCFEMLGWGCAFTLPGMALGIFCMKNDYYI